MRTAIVYESMFGNTRQVAEAVAEGLRGCGAEVEVLRADDAHDHRLGHLDLLVLAAPTHALTLSRAGTRADAVTKGADAAAAATGMREWLDGMDRRLAGSARPPVAVFDTRVRRARHWPGGASRTTVRALRRTGYTVLASTTFSVEDVTGPLVDGELARARAWSRDVEAARLG